jgi:thiamine-phosphate pyrophosphorylase
LLGAEAIARAREVAGACLLYALGGVTSENAASVLAAGAEGVAVIGAVLDTDDPLPLLEALGIRR